MVFRSVEFFGSKSRILGTTLLAAVLLGQTMPAASEGTVSLNGGGASFPAPLYLRWFRDYYRAHPKVRADYQAIGSGAGVIGFLEGRLDFAGTDVPLTAEQVSQAQNGVVQLPLTGGGIVLAYHLPGIDGLRLSRAALAGIFTGRIAHWDDPLIASANPDIALPNEPVTVIARSDASGTTYVMTRHLSAIDDGFAKEVGVTMTPVWPKVIQERGSLVLARGNDGVAAYVKAIAGSIGYVEYTYAALPGQQMATIENKTGSFVQPTGDSFRAAIEAIVSADSAKRPEVVADPDTQAAYPIVTLSWLLMQKEYKDPNKLVAFKDLVRYCITEGQAQSEALGYIPASSAVQTIMLERLRKAFDPGTD